MRREKQIDYVEIPVTDPNRARDFFAGLYGWTFETISKDIFSFPGGRRFHFVDPVGTEFAVWSDR